MDRSEVEKRVIKVVSEILKVDVADIKPENTFSGDLGAESIQSIELVAGFEEEFGIEMDEDAALSVSTVGGAIDFLASIVNA